MLGLFTKKVTETKAGKPVARLMWNGTTHYTVNAEGYILASDVSKIACMVQTKGLGYRVDGRACRKAA